MLLHESVPPNSKHIIMSIYTLFFSNFSLSQRLSGPGQTAEFVAQEKRLQWKIKKIFGKSEVTAVFKVHF